MGLQTSFRHKMTQVGLQGLSSKHTMSAPAAMTGTAFQNSLHTEGGPTSTLHGGTPPAEMRRISAPTCPAYISSRCTPCSQSMACEGAAPACAAAPPSRASAAPFAFLFFLAFPLACADSDAPPRPICRLNITSQVDNRACGAAAHPCTGPVCSGCSSAEKHGEQTSSVTGT